MPIKFKDNRVRRSYFESGIINKFLKKMPEGYPEDWIASVVEAFNPGFEKVENEGLSSFENGVLFKDYIFENPKSLGENKNISILVKFLDAGERLVIQCHPTDEFAQKYFNSPFGKTECWYIIDSTPDVYVYLGFNKTAVKSKWIEAFHKQDIKTMLSMLRKFKVKKGSDLFISMENCYLRDFPDVTGLDVYQSANYFQEIKQLKLTAKSLILTLNMSIFAIILTGKLLQKMKTVIPCLCVINLEQAEYIHILRL